MNSRPEMVEQLAAVQRACFPTLSAAERITAAHYAAHIRRFPPGQLAVVEDTTGRVVACSTDFRTSAIDLSHFEHRYIEAVDHNWLGHHDPAGDWLYGADIGVLPAYRQRGLARRLYQARHALVRRLCFKGMSPGACSEASHRIKPACRQRTMWQKSSLDGLRPDAQCATQNGFSRAGRHPALCRRSSL